MTRWAGAVVACAAVGAGGCRTNYPDVAAERDAVLAAVPGSYSDGSGRDDGGVEDGRRGLPAPVRWWTAFEDAGLDAAVARTFADNPSLAAAAARVRAARAIARREGAALLPAVDLPASAGTTRTETPDDPSTDADDDDFRLGVRAAYEVDLWGRLDALRDAARLDAIATAADAQALALSLAADVATTWFRLAESAAQEALLADQVETNAQVLELTVLRFRQGQVAAADVLRQQQLTEATRGQGDLQAGRTAVLRHQLAVLLGEPPEASGTPVPGAFDGVTVPALPELGVPSEVLRRRPDVRQAWLNVAAADRLVAAALADRYPRVEISASFVYRADRLRNLFDNWIATVAADLLQPLFDGGLRRAEIARTRARTAEALAQYKDAVLTALQETEDALAQERAQGEFLLSLERQLAVSGELIERTRERYTAGQFDYLRVLEALTSQQSLQRDVLRARRELLEFRVDLYRSVAGPVTVTGEAVRDE